MPEAEKPEFAVLIQLYPNGHGVCSFGGEKSDSPKHGMVLAAALLYIHSLSEQYGVDGNQILADLNQMAEDDAIMFLPGE